MRRSTARVTQLLMWLLALAIVALLLFPGDPQGDPPSPYLLLLIPAFLVFSLIVRALMPTSHRRF